MSELTAKESAWLRAALRLAAAARASGNPPFGSLIVASDGRLLAEAQNTTITDADITAHPELKLARWTARSLTVDAARDVTMYTSCEPCPMCANAIARAAIGRVVFALSTAQLERLKPEGTPRPDAAPVISDGPHLPGEAQAPLVGYYAPP